MLIPDTNILHPRVINVIIKQYMMVNLQLVITVGGQNLSRLQKKMQVYPHLRNHSYILFISNLRAL